MRCRNRRDDVKTWYSSLPGINLRDTCLLLRWHPAHRWRDLYGGFYLEHRNLSSGWEGKHSSSDNCKNKRTNAGHRGGLAGSSDEAFVMKVERSGQLIQLIAVIN